VTEPRPGPSGKKAHGSSAFPDHFSDRAGGYARFRPSYPRELVEWLAHLAPGKALAWDAGCGSGQLSVRLADRFEHVVATDASPSQLERATPHPRVEYRPGLAEDSGLPPGAVDLATAAQAAHWFDLDAYYREVRRVGAPGAVLALISYGMPTIDSPADQVLKRFHDQVLAPHWPPERRHVEEGYRSIPFPFTEVEGPSFELTAEWTREEFLGYLETWSTVARLEKEEGRGRIEAFRKGFLEAWGSEKRTRTVVWPLALRVGRL
jgi:SAM-dependent methyltransferase